LIGHQRFDLFGLALIRGEVNIGVGATQFGLEVTQPGTVFVKGE